MLVERLRDIDSPVWIETTGRVTAAQEVHRDVMSLRQRFSGLRGKRVALRCESTLETARGMLLLDGFCEQLLLTHAGTSDNEFAEFCTRFLPDFILTDDDLRLGATANCVDGQDQGTEFWDSVWVIPTSGTTGTPKLIPHTLRSLTRTVKPAISSYRPVWGLMYGITRFAGLQVFLQSFLGGGTLLFPPQGKAYDVVIRFLIAHGATSLSATATMWRKILMTPNSELLPLRQVTLGGEIVEQQVLDAVKRRFPQARIIHIYASTEAGVGFAVKDCIAGFPSFWLTKGIDGVELEIRNGCLWLRVPGRSLVLQNGRSAEVDESGFMNTGDLVRVEGNRVSFVGRKDGVINVGGDKVSPEEIENVLLSHPDVALASVRGVKNPISGQIVVADVVLIDEAKADLVVEKNIQAYCRTRLGPNKVPAQITFVRSMDINDSGKLPRRI